MAESSFFERPILNSPYEYPGRHWELDEDRQPTNVVADRRRRAEFITPIPRPKKRSAKQAEIVFDEGQGLSTEKQQYDQTSIINEVRNNVDNWRQLAQSQWQVAALGADRPNALFFAGDLGQRIFQAPFSWKALGVDVRGRSRTLRVNYRTSHQIREQADRLLGPEVADVDGNRESRRDAISVFNGPPPVVRTFATERDEIDAVGVWLAQQLKDGVRANEIGIFTRSTSELPRAQASADVAGLRYRLLDEKLLFNDEAASIATMHMAKGFEFRAVAVMGCDDEILPLQERIENVGDDADLQEVYDTERHLLYVACTRARDALSVTAVESASEFLADMAEAKVADE